ncbi:MAG: hypothetical protein V7K38_23785 [Nostoc sp.]|uniref:hypothetical protein n=1 Tax=Nostoc sp. TaxID=1180 RepID=UPI002FF79870
MPLTQAYLESAVETVEEFQMRRIKWAIKLLDKCGEEIMRWKGGETCCFARGLL